MFQTNETRKVSHFFCYSWPDFGVPTSKTLEKLVVHARKTQASLLNTLEKCWIGHPLGPPIVVHCSAGVGRTGLHYSNFSGWFWRIFPIFSLGTFILIDIALYRLENEGVVDLRGTLMKLRQQRPLSVVMPSQFSFCHRVLIQYAINRGLLSFDINPEDFDDNIQIDAVHRVIINQLIEYFKNAMEKRLLDNKIWKYLLKL